MELSAGFIIIDKSTKKVLACHPTGRHTDHAFSFDIPKGHVEPGETPIEAATRELREESGIVLPEGQPIHEIGHVHYNSKKSLHLFSTEMDVNLDELHCTSMFTDSYGNRLKEVDKFILTDRCDQFFFNMRRHIIKELQRRYGINLVQFKADGQLVDNYIPTHRWERIHQLLVDNYSNFVSHEHGDFEFDFDGDDSITVTNADVAKAINGRHTVTTDFWLHLASKGSLYEPFPFEQWIDEEVLPR